MTTLHQHQQYNLEGKSRSKSKPANNDKNKELFVLNSNQESDQFFNIYQQRLKTIRPVLVEMVIKCWGKQEEPIICRRLLNCETGGANQTCIIIGTIFKRMDKKKSPLDQFRDDDNKSAGNGNTCDDINLQYSNMHDLSGIYVDKCDSVFIEDEQGRLPLSTSNCLAVDKCVTGLPIALKGALDEKGIFIVRKCLFAGVPPIKNYLKLAATATATATASKQSIDIINNNSGTGTGTGTYIAFVSGIECARSDPTHHLSIQLLFDFMSGFSANCLSSGVNARISHVMMAGNVLGVNVDYNSAFDDNNNISFDKNSKQKIDTNNEHCIASLKQLESYLVQLCSTCPVDMMPGNKDPTNHLLPQQAIHPCLFPLLTAYSGTTFKSVTNPYQTQIGDLLLLGSSGQNIADMIAHSRLNAIECLELTLASRVLAPTAPDTLACIPCKDEDPFLIHQCPNVYFAGNCDTYKSKFIKNNQQTVCLLMVPSFAKTKQIVLLNVNTLQSHCVQIKIGL